MTNSPVNPWWADILTGATYGVFGGLLVKAAGSAAWWVTLLGLPDTA